MQQKKKSRRERRATRRGQRRYLSAALLLLAGVSTFGCAAKRPVSSCTPCPLPSELAMVGMATIGTSPEPAIFHLQVWAARMLVYCKGLDAERD